MSEAHNSKFTTEVHKADLSYTAPEITKEQLTAAFKVFDTDSSGTLTVEELMAVLTHPATGRAFTDEDAKMIIAQYDTNHDGVIDYEEFAAVFKDIGFRASMLKKGGQHMAPEVLRRLQEDERKMKELIAKEEHEADLIQAGMRMASGDVTDAHNKVDALEAFITYSAADYKLWHDRKADWDKAMTKFAEFAFGLVKTKPPTPLLLTKACIDDMAEGEPAYKGGLALLLWHPFERGCLKVFAATEGSEYETGMNVKEKSGMPASIDVWAAIHAGESVLRNPHNLPESAGQRSVALIKGRAPKQDIIGVIVSSPATGGNALPDVYLSAFSGMAGPLFERNVKLAQITCMLKVACTFIEKVALSAEQLIYAIWHPGERMPRPDDWDWHPRLYDVGEGVRTYHTIKSGHEEDTKAEKYNGPQFEMELRWKRKGLAPMGVLVVDCSRYINLEEAENEHMFELLHVIAPLVQKAAHDIEDMSMQDPVPLTSMNEITGAFNQARILLPAKLQAEVRGQLSKLEFHAVFEEIQRYKAESIEPALQAMLTSIVILVGGKDKKGHERTAAALQSWDEVRIQMTKEFAKEMLDLDLIHETESLHKRWAESMRASAGVDLHKLLITASVPMRMLIRWLISTRMLHSVALKIAQEEEHHYYTMLDEKPSIHHRAHAPSAADIAKMMQDDAEHTKNHKHAKKLHKHDKDDGHEPPFDMVGQLKKHGNKLEADHADHYDQGIQKEELKLNQLLAADGAYPKPAA